MGAAGVRYKIRAEIQLQRFYNPNFVDRKEPIEYIGMCGCETLRKYMTSRLVDGRNVSRSINVPPLAAKTVFRGHLLKTLSSPE